MKKGKELQVKEVLEYKPLDKLPKINCKTPNQKLLCKAIKEHEIVICTGPAGTGKTHLTLLQALHLLKKEDQFKQIILVKSVTSIKEESIGFIPGTVDEKMAPYMYSFTYLIDKIFEKKGKANKLISDGIIEILPLAFIRGVNIENAIILVDEAQNTSSDLFKTIISRLGDNSKMIFLGDIEQIDLKDKKTSCLKKICEIFKDNENVKIVELTDEDCVRNKKIPAILQVLRDNNL